MAQRELDEMLRGAANTRVGRRGFLAGSALAGVSAFLAACSSNGSVTQPPTSGPTAAPPTSAASEAPASAAASEAPASEAAPSYAIEGGLYMFNWADYISEKNIEEFKKRYGITDWTYDIYGSNADLHHQAPGRRDRPVRHRRPDRRSTCRPWSTAGSSSKIDWSKIPNAKYINPKFKGLWWDPNDEYQLPKDWGTTGITVRQKYVDGRRVELEEVLRGGAQVLGQDRHRGLARRRVHGAAEGPRLLAELARPDELGEARKLLMELAPHVLLLNSDNYEVQLGSGEAVIGLTWTGGIDELIAAPETADTKYIIPEDGTLYWMDTWVILADPPHPEGAHAFLNFIHEPEIQAQETISNAYATPNDEAKKYIPPRSSTTRRSSCRTTSSRGSRDHRPRRRTRCASRSGRSSCPRSARADRARKGVRCRLSRAGGGQGS